MHAHTTISQSTASDWECKAISNIAKNISSPLGNSEQHGHEEVDKLTGQNLFKVMISPLSSTSFLAVRHSITIERAGNHDLA